MSEGWIGVDLDGTLAERIPDKDHDEIGEPREEVVSYVKKLIKQGFDVRLCTARASNTKAVHAIEEWLEENFGELLPITNEKDHEMIVLIDDRVVNPLYEGWKDQLEEMLEEWEEYHKEKNEENEDD